MNGMPPRLRREDRRLLDHNRGVLTIEGRIVSASNALSQLMGFRNNYHAAGQLIDHSIMSRDPGWQLHLDQLEELARSGKGDGGNKWHYTSKGWKLLHWKVDIWVDGHAHFRFEDVTHEVTYLHWVYALNLQKKVIDLSPFIDKRMKSHDLQTLHHDLKGTANPVIAEKLHVTKKAVEATLTKVNRWWMDVDLPGRTAREKMNNARGFLEFARANPNWLNLQPRKTAE